MNELIVMEILKKSKKSLNLIDIINMIKNTYSSEDLTKLREILGNLILSGDIIQTKNGAYMDIGKTNAVKGKLQFTKGGNAFLLGEDKDIFVPKNKLNGANDNDIVVAIIKKDDKGKQEAFVKTVVKRNIESSLAVVTIVNNKVVLKSLSNKQYVLIMEDTKDVLTEGLIVKIDVLEKISANKFKVKVINVIGHKNDPDIDTRLIFDEYGVVIPFSHESLDELKKIPNDISNEDISRRVDLRESMEFTIDNENTDDIDDAIRLKRLDNGNYVVCVDLADVTHYIKPGMSLWQEAMDRSNSHYTAGMRSPMLPPEISNGICSLNENAPRLAFTIETEINSLGEVINRDTFLSVIKSNKKMSYEDVNKIFNKEKVEGYEEYCDTLLEMLKVSDIIEKNLIDRGKIDFIAGEPILSMGDDHKIIDIFKKSEGKAEKLIEMFMITANETAAYLLSHSGSPVAFRIHDTPEGDKLKNYMLLLNALDIKATAAFDYDEEIKPSQVQALLKELVDNDKYLFLNKELLCCMKKATYCPKNMKHFALGSDYYCHITAAIRRAIDMINQYLVKNLIIEKNYNDSFIQNIDKYLPTICDYTSKMERVSVSLEQQVNNMKIAEYMEKNIGNEYNAFIDKTLTNGFFVETDESLSGFVPLSTLDDEYTYDNKTYSYQNKGGIMEYQIGDRVRVKSIKASKVERKIEFSLVKKP
ncbi:MAG: VacB/RNase II family 3'-5' exoribonuclease [Bacilli bacterium]